MENMKFSLVQSLFILGLVQFISGADYCKLSCNGQTNIGCNNDGKLQSSCPSDAQTVEFTQNDIDQILQLHNDLRNSVANGSLAGFDSAARMAKLVWSDDLAYLAGLNTRDCNFNHDQCHNTDDFRAAGQNLGMVSKSNKDFDNSDVIRQIIVDMWFGERKNANMNVINSFIPQTDPNKEYGHFTEFITGNSTAIGCGATRYKQNSYFSFYLACNYARSNVEKEKIYESGNAGSGCTKGTDTTYSALCKTGEPTIDPNYLF